MIQGPIITTNLEKEALLFAEKAVAMGEPCSLIGIGEMAQEVLFRELAVIIPKQFENYQLISAVVTNEEDIKQILKDVENQSVPTILLVNIATPDDSSFFVDTVDTIRLKQSIHFIPVILSDIKSLYSALITHKKSVTRSLFILKPLGEDESNLLLESFIKRFNFTLVEKQKETIFQFGTGHFGLTKALFLLQQQHPQQKITPEWLLSQTAVIQRLTVLANQIPLPVLKNAIFHEDHLNLVEKQFLENFGYLNHGKIFNPLLETFLRKILVNSDATLHLLLTEIENTALLFLKKHTDQVISRENLAEEIWGANWEDKYSDWAIDQLIHRIREKLEKTKSPYEIVTKKGEGFYLQTT